ncbi:peptidase [Microbacterium sp. AISO3]|uniref:Trp biosynthesis-associated membrane protein n=1 Tax=unclassified Microbacterium TaxID=2609290 RepID=UPI000B4C26FC|nr:MULTISPECIES: Trp biosynthesis-associated membrane protein [unclassified Microbacterium]OWP22970.1 peptidase [Microbacterium sp. AISO3]POX66904.1 peptidase [Microbacterium sp. Ru50]
MRRRSRMIAVLAAVVGGGLAVIGATQPWLEATLRDGAQAVLPVPGTEALPLVTPLGLAALALGLALSIVGTVLRYAFGVIGVLIGASLLVESLRIALTAPPEAVVSVVADATGLAGVEAVGTLVSAITVTAWPWITAVGAAAVCAGGVLTLVTARSWRSTARRYRTDAAAEAQRPGGSRPHDSHDPIDSWDDLSRGSDPTV